MTGEFQSILYRQDGNDPSVFFYVPGDPSAEVTGGSPAASMVATGSGGFLQLGVHWDASQAQLDQMQDYLRHQFPKLDALPQLRRETLAVDAVNLALRTPDGKTNLLATTGSSGFPPFTALFNLSLDAAQFAQASSALRGREKVLTVSYQISGQSTVSCTATIKGDVRADVEQLDANADIDSCLARIESALSAGRLEVEVAGDNISDTLRARATSSAKDRAASVLQRMLAGSDTDLDAAHLLASATLNETRPVKLIREADVGRWFSGTSAQILVAGSSGSQAPSDGPDNRTYKMGFDPKDLPIAYVQMSSGSSKQAFRPPAFSPVTLAVDSNKPVTITTNYSDGGPAYQAQLPAADESVLTPRHLGFCLVSVDGSGRKQAGAKSIKLQVKYIPDRNGSEDQHTTVWAFGDWIDSWYVTSRDSGLAGVIEYSWRETAADGTVTDNPRVRTRQTEIRI
jgi:hypothetical protein